MNGRRGIFRMCHVWAFTFFGLRDAEAARKALAYWALHLDQAAQRAEVAKLQDPSECPRGGKDSSCSWGASEALTKTGRTLQSCKCNKTTQKTRKRKISNNVYKGLGYGPSFLKLANQRGQCHWFLQQRFQLALLGCSTLLEAVFLARKVTFPSHPDTFLSSLLLFLFSLPLSSTENSMRSSGRNSVTAKSI